MKLIILNGSPAAGKSTVAARLHQDIPMSLLVDGDLWRTFMSGWRENREEGLRLTYKILVAAADTYLESGHDVIVDKAILSDNSVLDALTANGKKHNAEVFEFMLTTDKETITKRAHSRGFHERGLLTPQRVEELWHVADKLKAERPHAVVIDTGELDAEAVYQKIKDIIKL